MTPPSHPTPLSNPSGPEGQSAKESTSETTTPSVISPAGSALTIVLLATVALAMKGLLAKFVYATGMTVDGLLLLRFLIAMPFFWLGVFMFGKNRPGERKMKPVDVAWGALYGGLFFLAALFDFTAVSLIDVTVSRIVLFTFPAVVMILEAVHKGGSPISTSCLLCCDIWWLGVGACARWVWRGVRSIVVWGCLGVWLCPDLCGLSLFWATDDCGHRFHAFCRPDQHCGWYLHDGLCADDAKPTEPEPGWHPVDGGHIDFCTVIPFFLLYEGIRRVGATQASLISLSGPAMTFFAAWLFLGEVLTVPQLFGFVIVTLGVASLKNSFTLAGLGRLLARPFGSGGTSQR